ncbi:CUB domain-containing protein [Aphelenchoides besseyi]|nr:CUB domain-containing protein [Aphelenchoides besseyi]KAI6199824.1 CUB domain-containing protein [Aphelenchoides besseyi]
MKLWMVNVANSLPFILVVLFVILNLASSKALRCQCGRRVIRMNEENDKVDLFSPDFPRPYCSNLDCHWTLVSEVNGTLIHFLANKIDLRSQRDFLYFYENENPTQTEEPAFNCTGRRVDCEFTSTSNFLTVRFKSGRGVPDRFGFKGVITLLTDEFQNLTEDDSAPESLISAWNFVVWIVLIFCVFVGILAVVYFFCLRKKTEENRSPLLRKSSQREDDMHLPIHSPAPLTPDNE